MKNFSAEFQRYLGEIGGDFLLTFNRKDSM